MRNENQSSVERERRVLVIEDDMTTQSLFREYNPGVFDFSAKPHPDYDNVYEFNLPAAEDLLKTVPYSAILLDGNLGTNLEGKYFDGVVVARRIRDGFYGDINRDAPIYGISSQYDVFPESLRIFGASKPKDEVSLERLVKRLKQDGVLN